MTAAPRLVCRSALLALLVFAMTGTVAKQVAAQVVDSLRLVTKRRPIAEGVGDIADLLARLPGSFLYDFGPDGWPDSWSPDGVDPSNVALHVGAVPFDDPITGAPAWDLLPVSALRALSWSPMDRSAQYAVGASLSDTLAADPSTEVRYRSGSGLQAIDVGHAQRRPATLFGQKTTLGLEFGYSGAGSAGEYEGSRLRRKRQIFLRAATVVAGWSGSAMILTNRHRVGAHAGVVAPTTVYESIYNRLLAGVEHTDAVRERYRSDVVLTASRPVFGRDLGITAYRTQQLLRYVRSGDSTSTRVVRYGMEASMPVLNGSWPLRAVLTARRDTYPDSSALGKDPGARSRFEASLEGTRAMGPATVEYAGGLVRSEESVDTSARVGGAIRFGRLGVSLDAVTAPVETSTADVYGFGSATVGLAPFVGSEGIVGPVSRDAGRSDRIGVGATVEIGPLQAGLRAFAQRASGVVLWVGTNASGSAEALREGEDLLVRGAVVSFSVREDSPRGFYGIASATHAAQSGGTGVLANAYSGSLPAFFGRAVAGWRGSLFRGDAVVDFRAEAHAWTTMRGRQPATATGQLVLAYAESRDVPGSTILDLKADVVVRGATFFLSLENLLSGTELIYGNQVVADYPYPEQRWRFGVFWPIPD